MMILVGPFHFSLFCDSVFLGKNFLILPSSLLLCHLPHASKEHSQPPYSHFELPVSLGAF